MPFALQDAKKNPLSLLSTPKISEDFPHPACLRNVEGTAFIAMAAPYAVARLLFQLVIVAGGQLAPIVFVDKAHVQSGRTGLTVITVDAFSRCALGAKEPRMPQPKTLPNSSAEPRRNTGMARTISMISH